MLRSHRTPPRVHHIALRARLTRALLPLTWLAVAGVATGQEIHSANGGGSWSAPTSWNRVGVGPATPQPGDAVVITVGSPITLDTAPPLDLASLQIHDVFTVADTQSYHLQVARVDVGGPGYGAGVLGGPGELRVGSASSPFVHGFDLELTDHFGSSAYTRPITRQENMSLVVHANSTIELHGRKVSPDGVLVTSWSQLGANLLAGAANMSLATAADPGWHAGDRVVIASTDFAMERAEVVTVATSAVNGAVTLQGGGASNYHHGSVEFGVDERAEVGLLSHNIRVYSQEVAEPEDLPPGDNGRQNVRAGHVMCMGPGVRAVFERVEFHHLGWRGARGRYPVHFHMLGNNHQGIAVRGCSVHSCFNRAIVVHGTDGCDLEDNVVYDTYGHAVHLEDRSEVGNKLHRNLVLSTKKAPLPLKVAGVPAVDEHGEIWHVTQQPFQCKHDSNVASFWIGNTDNSVVDNHAAGSESYGFWYDVSTNNPDPCVKGFGEFAALYVGAPGREFRGNVGHSNGFSGFFSDPTRWMPFDPALTVPLQAHSLYEDFTAYKNRRAGVWNRGQGAHVWRNVRVADNQLGVYFGSEGGTLDGATNMSPWGSPLNMPALAKVFDDVWLGAPVYSLQLLEDSIVVGDSNNPGSVFPDPNWPQREQQGVALYDGLIYIKDTDFFRFQTLTVPAHPVTGQYLRMSVPICTHTLISNPVAAEIAYTIDPRNAVENCTFDASCDYDVLFQNPRAPGVAALRDIKDNQITVRLYLPVDAPGSAPLLGAPGLPTQTPTYFGNALESAMILDVDGCLRGSFPGAYHVHESPLLRPLNHAAVDEQIARQVATGLGNTGAPDFFGDWSRPLVFGGPDTPEHQAIAQLEWTVPEDDWNDLSGCYYAELRSLLRGEQRRVYDELGAVIRWWPGATHPPDDKSFNANILLTQHGSAEEWYEVTYPPTATIPDAFHVRLQFGPALSPSSLHTAVFKVLYPAPGPGQSISIRAGHSHVLPGGVSWDNEVAPSLATFSAGKGFWFHDGTHLYLRAFLSDLRPVVGNGPLRSEVFGGRELFLEVSTQ